VRAAARSCSTTHASPAGSVASRCVATASGAAPSSAKRRAARAWPAARAPAASSPATAACRIGCAKASGRPGRRIPAAAIASAAAGFRRLELRERCGVAQLRVGPEDGQCPGRAAGTRPEPVDAHQHGACDGPRAELAHPLGVGGGGVDVLLGEGAHELADEERRAARGLVAGGGEGRLRLYADERGDGVDAQRPRAHQSRAGLGGQVGDHRRCCRTLCAGTRTPSPWRSPSRPRR